MNIVKICSKRESRRLVDAGCRRHSKCTSRRQSEWIGTSAVRSIGLTAPTFAGMKTAFVNGEFGSGSGSFIFFHFDFGSFENYSTRGHQDGFSSNSFFVVVIFAALVAFVMFVAIRVFILGNGDGDGC